MTWMGEQVALEVMRNMRDHLSQVPEQCAECMLVSSKYMIEENKKLINLFVELREILECSPETPWKGCKEQSYSNMDHYDGHPDAIEKIIAEALDEDSK